MAAPTSLVAVWMEAKPIPGHAASAGTGQQCTDAVGTPALWESCNDHRGDPRSPWRPCSRHSQLHSATALSHRTSPVGRGGFSPSITAHGVGEP